MRVDGKVAIKLILCLSEYIIFRTETGRNSKENSILIVQSIYTKALDEIKL